jgi:multiple sugar transport system substrate-binding protein
MKKNKIVLLLGMVILLSAWWLINDSSRAQPEEDILDVWLTWGDQQEPLQEIFAQYSQTSGVTVKVTTRVRSDDLLEAINKHQPPDLVILSTADLVDTYADQGLIEPLDDWIELRGIDLEDIYPSSLEQCDSQDGLIYCLPWGCDTELLYWNKDLFAAAGLDPEHPPQTTQEVVEYTAKLSLRNEEGELIQAGFIPDYPHEHSELFLRRFGVTNLSYDSPNVEDATSWVDQINAVYAPGEIDDFVASFTPYSTSSHPLYAGRRLNCQQCHRSSSLQDKPIPEVGFYKGQVAMMLDGHWLVSSGKLAREHPQLNYGVAPPPSPIAGLETSQPTLVQGPVAIIPAGAVDKEAATHLLAWMNDSKILAEVAYASAMLPTSRAAAQDPIFRQIPYFEILMNQISHPSKLTQSSPQTSIEVDNSSQTTD